MNANITRQPSPVLARLPSSVGIGLNPQHFVAALDASRAPDQPGWIEVHPQNYFGDGGPPHRWLSAIAEVYPVSFHSVGLSLGSADGVNNADLDDLTKLCARYDPQSISDHISFSGNSDDRLPDLLPIPYTNAALDHFGAQVGRVQDRLNRQILLENPARVLAYSKDEMDEVEFIDALITRTGCGLLFDINNVEVSATNLGYDPVAYIDRIKPEWVGEIHLAGHAVELHDTGPLLIDDHGSAVTDMTWALFRRFIARAGPKPVLVEWDTDVPEYDILMAEVRKARDIMEELGHADTA
jgi:uncharacterized protein